MTVPLSILPSGPVEPARARIPARVGAVGIAAIELELSACWQGVPIRWAVVGVEPEAWIIEGAVWREVQA